MGVGSKKLSDNVYYNNILAGIPWVERLAMTARLEVYEIFLKETHPTAESKILDVGVSVTGNERMEENILEKNYAYPEKITMLGIHEGAFLEQKYAGSKYVQYSADAGFPFSENEFDVCYCNAVLEHVGERQNQKQFIAELLRVSRKVFLTTPNRAYPVDFHKMFPFLHWLPMNVYRKILGLIGDEFYSKAENLNLLYRSDLRRLFEESCVPFRLFSYYWLGLPAHLIVVAK